MEPGHFFSRSRLNEQALEDTAYDYVEREVGRHDWKRNWPKFRERHGQGLRERIAGWLKRYELEHHDPQSIIDFLDLMVRTRHGTWK